MKSKLSSLETFCKNNPDQAVTGKLYRLICDATFLEMAYNNIKSNPITPGVLSETLDGISKENFSELSESLKRGTFRFKPGRRIQIPKASGGTRPLTIASPRDKIVQEAIRIILNMVYEPTFLDTSHGFRPERGCHTALRETQIKFKSAAWVIGGDISKCFDSIDHAKLINLIETKIHDRQFTTLIRKSLKCGYFEFRH